MRAASAGHCNVPLSNVRIDLLQHAISVDKQPREIAGVADANKILLLMFMQRDQPEHWRSGIQAVTHFAERCIPRLTNFAQKEMKQWRLVPAPILPAAH